MTTRMRWRQHLPTKSHRSTLAIHSTTDRYATSSPAALRIMEHVTALCVITVAKGPAALHFPRHALRTSASITPQEPIN